MKKKHPYLSSLALAAALAVPAIVATTPALQAQVGVSVRFYDRDHKDYHTWDDREDRAYRAYLAENHRDYVEFKRVKRADQRAYWRWRHDHPDAH